MEMDFSSYVTMLETTLEKAGIDPTTCRTNTPNEWLLRRGSAQILLFFRVSKDHTGDLGVFVALSPIMEAPEDEALQNKMAKHLMAVNHSLISERFTYSSGWIYLMSARPVVGLQPEEMLAMVDSLSYWADYMDDQIKAEYEGNTNPDQPNAR